ncbi:MAG: YitT family protein [Rikenella sp.]|nr:YitT family protein [Rikenella sp.]
MKKKIELDWRNIRYELRAYLIMTLGLMMYSFAWTELLLPAEVIGGGGGGIGAIVFYLTGIPMGVTYLVFNAILLALGFWILGPKFGAKTIYGILVNSLALYVMQQTLPPDLVGLHGDKFLSAILGGGIAGAGVGLCFSVGGSSGGTDILAMIINKYRNISLGKLIILMDVVIVGCSYFVSWDLGSVVYGYVTMFTLGTAIDWVLSGSKASSQIMVFSAKYQEIADRVIHDVNRGVTILDATGAYSKAPQKVALIVCRRGEASAIYRIIKEIDPKAFITQASVMGVFGEGFDVLKTK